MAVRSRRPGATGTVTLDLRRLHAGWMGLAFPSRRVAVGRVHGHRVPDTTGGRIAYDGWVGLGALVVVLLYPLVVAGLVLRDSLRRIDRAAGLGAAGSPSVRRTTTALLFPTSVLALLFATPLDGTTAVGLGLGIAVPIGWLLGGAVTLADLVRPGRRGRI